MNYRFASLGVGCCLLTLGLALAGCRPSNAPTTPGMSAGLDRQIRGWYAHRWGCEAGAMKATRVGEVPNDGGLPWSIYEYAGCGHTSRLFTACEFADSCTEWSESVESRAEHDVDCPKNQLKMRVLDKSTIAVDGCGHKVTYISDRGGLWIMNNHAERSSGADRKDSTTVD